MKKRLGVVVVAATLLLSAGCAREPATVAPPAVDAGANRIAATDLDRHYPEDSKFYGPMAASMEGVLLGRPPADVPAATKESTVVVAARVDQLSAQRIIGDVQTIGVQLTDIEVLSGKLEPSLNGAVTVELTLGEPVNVEKQVDAFRAALPKGYGIWFLRWQGAKKPVTKKEANPAEDPADSSLYGVVHRQAMFIQGADHVVNPITEHSLEGRSLPGLQRNAEAFPKLSDLANKVRAS